MVRPHNQEHYHSKLQSDLEKVQTEEANQTLQRQEAVDGRVDDCHYMSIGVV